MKKLLLLCWVIVTPSLMFAQSNIKTNQKNSQRAEICTEKLPSVSASASTFHHSPYNNGAKSAVIFNNGSLVNKPGAGVGGADYSLLQSPNTSWGFGCQHLSGSRVAEDFYVNAASWTIDSIVFFNYQTGSTTTSTFTRIDFVIWNGVPGAPGSTIVWGDSTINRLSNSTWSGIYRGSDTTLTNRPIMRNVCATPALSLNAGNYWIDWDADGSGTSGPWAPPITITGQPSTGNAMQYISGTGWAPLMDGANQQGLPFIIYGTANNPFNCDLGVIDFKDLASSCNLSNAVPIKVEIKNWGAQDQTGFPVSYSVNGGNIKTDTCHLTVSAGGTVVFSFTAPYYADLSSFGVKNLKAWTSAPADSFLGSDTSTTYSITNIQPATAPYYQGFETALELEGELIVDVNGDANTWVIANSAGLGHSGSSFAVYSYNTDAVTPANDWLITKCINLNAGVNYQLSFWYHAKPGYPENLKAAFGTAQLPDSMNHTLIDLTNITDTVYMHSISNFTVPTTSTYYFGFQAHSAADEWDLFLDDIAIGVGVNIAEPFNENNISIYPNPTKDFLKITANQPIKEILLFNSFGQNVYSKQIDSFEESLNTSTFASGIYYMNIKTSSGSTVRKVSILK